jgi:tRNA threonylcarbamoyl adenosine modification protein YeaZ
VVVDSATPAVTAAVARVEEGGAASPRAGGAASPRAGGAASPRAGGAASPGVTVLAERVTVDARAHGELLAPAVAAVLAEAGVKPASLDAVVAGVGPGPFTGLRVGLVTAVALTQALSIPAYGVCSLDAVPPNGDRVILVATDARRREIYWAVYADGVRIHGPAVGPPDEAAAEARALGATRAVGDGALRYADALGLPVRDEHRYPDAGALASLAADRIRSRAPGEPLTPLYLRRPDATPRAATAKTTLQ